MRVSTLILTGFLCIMMAGCSVLSMPASQPGNYVAVKPVDIPINTAIDEMIAYSRYYDSLSAAEQNQECRRLRQTLDDEDSSIKRLRMVLALSHSPECGEPTMAIELLKTIIANEGAWFADYQTSLLERMQQQQEDLRKLKGNLKSSIRRQHELKDKLEALKSIEKSINERKKNHESDQK